jgi:hypothetical protein
MFNSSQTGDAARMEKPKPQPQPLPPQIDTPVIDVQEFEPHFNELPELDLSKDDEKAREAIEELERTLRQQPPG